MWGRTQNGKRRCLFRANNKPPKVSSKMAAESSMQVISAAADIFEIIPELYLGLSKPNFQAHDAFKALRCQAELCN